MGRLIALLLTITIIGGLTPIGARMAVTELPPLTVAGVRFGTAGVLLWLTLRVRGTRLSFGRGDLPRLLGLAVLCVPVNQLGFLVGIKLANASHAGLFYALTPVLVFWISVGLGRSMYSGMMLAAAVLAFAGAAAVIYPSMFGGSAARAAGRSFMAGDLLLLLAVASWSAFVVLSKPVIERFGPLRTLTAVFLLGAAVHTPLALVDVGSLAPAGVTWRGLAGLAYVTLVTCYVNYLLIYMVLARHDATRAMIVLNGHFVITAVVEWQVYDEPLTVYFLIGCGLIAGAIALDAARARHVRPKGS